MATKLPHQVKTTSGIPNGLRTATVVSVDSGGVTVSINGATVDQKFGYLDSTPLQPGDVVSVFRQDSSWLVLGRATQDRGQWGLVTMASGFTQGSYPLAYRLTSDNNLQVSGLVISGASTGSGTTLGTVPAGFYSTTIAPLAQAYNASTGAGAYVQLTAVGELQLHGTWANGNSIILNTLYPLDHP